MRVEFDTSEVARLAVDLDRGGLRTLGRCKDAVQKTAGDVEGDAKILCPVDTGFLRGTINTSSEDGGLAAVIGPTAHYGKYVEEGTSRMAPQPYLGPAFDRRSPELSAAVARIADPLD